MKKTLSMIVILALAISLLTSCSPQNGGDAATAPGSATVAAKTEVTIGFPSVPSSFDPLTTGGHGSYMPLIYSTLVRLDADVNVVPDLAESYAVSDDALAYTFKLRTDAKFSDGEPVKPSDVTFSFNTMMTTEGVEVDLSAIESVKAEGDTVTIRLKRPRSTFILDVAGIGIAPERLYGADFGQNPVGSGPYKLAQYDVDQQFILEANEQYYGNPPKITRAVFIKMSDEDTQLIAARSGQVDITLTSAPLAATNVIEGYNLLVEKTVDNMGIVMPVIPAGSGTSALGNPMGNDITCDVALRKAIAYSIDREKLCKEALEGYATPAYSENDGMPWWNPECVIKTDVALAKKLLDDAGWADTDGDGIRDKNGMKASVPVYYFAGDTARQAAAMGAANQVRENIGVELAVTGLGEEDVMQIMVSQPMVLAWGSSNPITSYYLYHSSSIGKDDWYNPESFGSTVVDGYLDAALNAKSLDEAIPYWQKAQWDGKTGTSMRGECPYVFLVNKDHLYFRRDGLNTGRQMIHAHGAAWTLVANLGDWYWES